MARFEAMAQDGDGVWATPGGDRVAWFHDPDGNLLSLSQRA
jgi:catechol 2,3-dioxygenase-like lactoylglutathione lyase family enzyme